MALIKHRKLTRVEFESLDPVVRQDANTEWTIIEADGSITRTIGETPIGIQESCTNTTYANLVTLRNNSQLVPGAFYRITDYETTTVQAETQSAGHLFDIIVQALDEKTLSENASAIHSARDTEGYFANSKLEAWKLKYQLTHEAKYYETSYEYQGNYVGIINTNGQTFYAYEYDEGYYLLFNEAFSTNSNDVMVYELSSESIIDTFNDYEGGGVFFVYKPIQLIDDYKGYIYELIDEKNNKLSYDFKNIKFKRYKISNILDSTFSSFLNTYFAFATNVYEWESIWEVDSQDFDYFYTFDDNGSDASLLTTVNNNEIGASGFQNNIVCFGNNSNNNTIGTDFYNNTIGNNFNSNTIGTDFYNNTIGNNFNSNTIGNNFNSNTIGNNFNRNTIGNNSNRNTIGNAFNSNTIGNDLYSNTIGTDFYNNTIGNSLSSNTIGHAFNSNTIGNSLSSNTIGHAFNRNTIGNNSNSNTIGNAFNSNTIGNYFNNNTIGNYFNSNTIGNDVKYIQFSVDGTFSNQIRYLYLKDGLKGASSANKLNLYFSGLYHREYPTTFEIVGNGNIVSSWEDAPLSRAGKVKATKTTTTWSDI